MAVSNAPRIQERIAEEYNRMRTLRHYYGPAQCRPGSDNVFESSDVGTSWFTSRQSVSYLQGLLGTVGTQFRLGSLEPATYGRVVYRGKPITSLSAKRNISDSMYSKPVVVAREFEGEVEIGVGVSLRKAILKYQRPEGPFFGLPKMPFMTYSEKSSERIGVAALTLTSVADSSPLIRVRTIAGEGFDLFDEDKGGRVVKTYEADEERADAIVDAFHQAYWQSVCEPA
jgi:hypothetical protein